MKFTILCLFALVALINAQRFGYGRCKDCIENPDLPKCSKCPFRNERIQKIKSFQYNSRPSANEDLNRILQKVYERGVKALEKVEAKLSNTTQEEFNEKIQLRINKVLQKAYERNPNAFQGQTVEEVMSEVSSNWDIYRDSLKEIVKLSQDEMLTVMKASWQQTINDTRVEYEKSLTRLENDKDVQRFFASVSSGVDRFKKKYQNIVKKLTDLTLEEPATPRFIKKIENDNDEDADVEEKPFNPRFIKKITENEDEEDEYE